jgi:hypothetical protein
MNLSLVAATVSGADVHGENAARPEIVHRC